VPKPQQVLSSGGGGLASSVTGAVSTAASAFTNALIVFVIGVYLALDPGPYTDGIVRLVPKTQRDRISEVLAAIGHTLRWWMVGRGASMAVVGILTGVGLLIAGIPLAFSLGVIAALFSFVPYIGPIASAVPALLVALTVSPVKALYVLGIYAAVQFLESYLVTPLIQERAVSIPPALLVSVQVVAGVLAGALGVLLATPMGVALVVAVQMLYVEDALGDRVDVLGEGEAHTDEEDVAEDVPSE
jgi:predicted PurR-regulated permease PerM